MAKMEIKGREDRQYLWLMVWVRTVQDGFLVPLRNRLDMRLQMLASTYGWETQEEIAIQSWLLTLSLFSKAVYGAYA